MVISHHKDINNMKDQVNMLSLKPISPVKIFANENYLDELQDTELKRTIKIFIKELKELPQLVEKLFQIDQCIVHLTIRPITCLNFHLLRQIFQSQPPLRRQKSALQNENSFCVISLNVRRSIHQEQIKNFIFFVTQVRDPCLSKQEVKI